jgi:hypothetical protein
MPQARRHGLGDRLEMRIGLAGDDSGDSRHEVRVVKIGAGGRN